VHDLTAARKRARTSEDAAAIAWAENCMDRLRQALNGLATDHAAAVIEAAREVCAYDCSDCDRDYQEAVQRLYNLVR
jgi:hypothetical protein